MAMSFKHPILFLQYVQIFIVYTFVLSFTEGDKYDFITMELIHIDSPKSPFYNHSKPLSNYQKVENAIRRSFQRVNGFFPNNSELSLGDDIGTELMSNNGQYLMEYYVGTPSKRKMGIIDTGSSFIWLQCKPCEKCYYSQIPVFNPSYSMSFRNTSCESSECNSAKNDQLVVSCDVSSDQCLYELRYRGFDRYSKGRIVKDTLKIGAAGGARKVAFPNTIFGCSTYVLGNFSLRSSGVIGLGRGPLSLISQMGHDFKGKFSYCLVPEESESSSRISFGQNAYAYDINSVSTPIANTLPNNIYYLTLKGISVGDVRLAYEAVQEGNIKLDSGSAMTFLPPDLMYKLEASVASHISQGFESINLSGRGFSLCYVADDVEELNVPTITFHFKGADVKLPPSNTFITVDPYKGYFCLNILAHSRVSIYGSLAQTNFLVGFDLLSNLVTFKERDCTM